MPISSRPQRLSRNAVHCSQTLRLGHLRIAVAQGDDEGHRRQHQRQDDAGHDAGHEQRADRGVGGDAVQHQNDRGRHQDAERAGGRDHADAEPPGIAVLDHGRHHDRADRHHGGDARSRNRREHRAGRDAGEAKTARKVTDQRGRERDHAARDAAPGQEGAGKDEKRNRHDAEIVETGKQFQADAFDRHLRHREQEGQNGEAERNRDRHARQHQGKQQDENKSSVHHASPIAIGAFALVTSMPSTCAAS